MYFSKNKLIELDIKLKFLTSVYKSVIQTIDVQINIPLIRPDIHFLQLDSKEKTLYTFFFFFIYIL
jgi:hypothetical protein